MLPPLRRIALLVASLSGLCGAVGNDENDASVAQCLSWNPSLEPSTCDAERSCEQSRFSKECLVQPIGWQVPNAVIACCFRCCLRHWNAETGLAARRTEWAKQWTTAEALLQHPDLTIPRPEEVILSDMTMYAFSYEGRGKRWPSGFGVPQPDGNALAADFLVSIDANFDEVVTHSRKQFGRAPAVVVHEHDADYPTGKLTCSNTTGPKRIYVSNQQGLDPSGCMHAIPRGVHGQTTLAHFQQQEGEVVGSQARETEHESLLMCCCMQQRYGRVQAMDTVVANGLPCRRSSHEPPTAYLEMMLSSKFVLSPPGKGLNNFREWEALVSGSVPVVLNHTGLQKIWEELPMVIVDRWEEVTPGFLKREWERISSHHADFNMAKAYWPYWMYHFTQFQEDGSDGGEKILSEGGEQRSEGGDQRSPWLVTGCGRSGSHNLEALLRKSGLDVKHEFIGKDGAVSWPHAWSDRHRGERLRMPFTNRDGEVRWGNSDFRFSVVAQFVTHPLSAVASLLVCLCGNPSSHLVRNSTGPGMVSDKSWEYARAEIPGLPEEEVERAMMYWVALNAHVEERAGFLYHVGEPDLEALVRFLGYGPSHRPEVVDAAKASDQVLKDSAGGGARPSMCHKLTKHKDMPTNVTWPLLRQTNATLAGEMRAMAVRYGYAVEGWGGC